MKGGDYEMDILENIFATIVSFIVIVSFLSLPFLFCYLFLPKRKDDYYL